MAHTRIIKDVSTNPPTIKEIPFTEEEETAYAAEGVKAYKAAIKTERARRLTLPIPISLSDGRSFELDIGDIESRTNIQGRVSGAQYALSLNEHTAQPFRDHSNTEQQLTPSDWIEIGLQIDVWRTNIYEKSWALIAASTQVNISNDKYWAA